MIKPVEEILLHLKKRELIPKFIALFLAVILWAYISSTKLGEKSFKLNLDIKNLHKTLVISKFQNKSIRIILNGKKEELKSINFKGRN